MQQSDLDITTTMDSLAISPTKRGRRGPPAHEMTLASLSTESSVILNGLLEPEKTRDPLSFLEKHPAFKDGRVMPGTLVTPGPSFVTEVPPTQEASGPNDYSDSKASSVHMTRTRTAPLARAMSIEERTAFLDGLIGLSRGPPATVYAIHAHELPHIAESATKLGFHTGTVLPESGSGEEGLLILGRDYGAVKDLHARLSRDGAAPQSGIRAMAGGAVAGAVATFTGLALA